jgi:hypothetical protein
MGTLLSMPLCEFSYSGSECLYKAAKEPGNDYF